MIVVWLIFSAGIEGLIRSSHRDSARVSNPCAGRISPRICTPINGAAAPSPVRIGPHLSTKMSLMVLRWGGSGSFCVIAPIAFVGDMGGWCCWTWCAVVFAVVSRSCAGYFLFHVNKVHRCAYLYAHWSNDGILGIAGKLLMRRDNLLHLIKGIV